MHMNLHGFNFKKPKPPKNLLTDTDLKYAFQ